MKIYALLGLITVILYYKYIAPDVMAQVKREIPAHFFSPGRLAFAHGVTMLCVWLLWPLFALSMILYGLRKKARRDRDH